MFNREDFEKLGLVITLKDVGQTWQAEGTKGEELVTARPEIATLKTPEGKLLGVEVSFSLALMDRGNEAVISLNTAQGKGFAARGEDPSLDLMNYKDWFRLDNPEQASKEKIASLYFVDSNGSMELMRRVDGGKRGVYKNPGSAKNISLFAGSPWAAQETVMTIQTFNTSVMAKEGEAGGAVLNREPQKTFTGNFKVSFG